MERENYYQNLNNLTLFDYYRIFKTKNTRIMMQIAIRMGYGFGSGVVSAGINLQDAVGKEGRRLIKNSI